MRWSAPTPGPLSFETFCRVWISYNLPLIGQSVNEFIQSNCWWHWQSFAWQAFCWFFFARPRAARSLCRTNDWTMTQPTQNSPASRCLRPESPIQTLNCAGKIFIRTQTIAQLRCCPKICLICMLSSQMVFARFRCLIIRLFRKWGQTALRGLLVRLSDNKEITPLIWLNFPPQF